MGRGRVAMTDCGSESRDRFVDLDQGPGVDQWTPKREQWEWPG